MAIHKLKTNIPVVGTLKYADCVGEREVNGTKFDPQFSVKGNWDGIGEATIYLHASLLNDAVKLGLVEDTKELDKYGQPKLKVLDTRSRVKILREENGTKKRTTLSFADKEPTPSAPVKRSEGGPGMPHPETKAPQSPTPYSWEGLFQLYGDAVLVVATAQRAANVEPTAESVQSGAATLLIQGLEKLRLPLVERKPSDEEWEAVTDD